MLSAVVFRHRYLMHGELSEPNHAPSLKRHFVKSGFDVFSIS